MPQRKMMHAARTGGVRRDPGSGRPLVTAPATVYILKGASGATISMI